MSDDPLDNHDSSQTTSFEEWIEQHAEAQGVSRQELFEQLVSSYWTVNEMAELIDEREDDLSLSVSASDSADGDPSDPESSPEDDGFELSDIDSFEELFTRLETDFDSDNDLAETLANRLTWVEADLSADGSKRRITDPAANSLRRSSERRPRISDVRDRIKTLDHRLEVIEDNLTDEQEHTGFQDEFLEAVAGQLNQIDARIDELASEAEASREVLADRVDEVESDIDNLAAEIETVDQSLSSEYESVANRLDDLESSVDDQHRQLANEQQRLRSRLDAEFEDLETILTHLVTQADSHHDDLSRLRAERDALRSLLSEAAEHGVDAGECEVCGKQIDLGLLADPYCAECDSLLTGVEERSKWLFFSNVVITAEDDRIGTSPESASQESVPQRRGTEARPTQRSPSRADERDPASHSTDSSADPAGDGTAADDTAESAPESEFSFNDLKSRTDASKDKRPDSKPAAAADDRESESDASGTETATDTLLSDLDDLRREEDRDDKS